MNTDELARDKFNALFVAHDAKGLRSANHEQKSATKTVTKTATKNTNHNEFRIKEAFDDEIIYRAAG